MGRKIMKLKYFAIFLCILLLICCANTIYAASEDNFMELDQSDDIIPSNTNDMISISNDDIISNSQDDITASDNSDALLGANATESTSATASSTTTSPYKKFTNDLAGSDATVYLTGDIKISKPFEIKRNVVIDGQGYSIDAQKKTYIFKIAVATVTLKNLIMKNGISNKGGAILAQKANVYVKGCTFLNNKATDNGGAIFCYYGKLNVDKSTFTNNRATNNGGGIYVSTASLVVKNSIFKNNKIESKKKMGHGGAIFTYLKSSTISNTSFTSNACISKALKVHKNAVKYQFAGGAVYYNLGSHTLTGCTFTSNKASNHGGAVYGYQTKVLKILKSTFKNNKVAFEDGGAMSYNGKKLIIRNSNFTKNHAYEDGGVMDACSINKKKVKVIITGTLFDSNTAYKGGGTIWMGVKSTFTLKNNKFINNEGGMGGALFSEASFATLNKCIFQGNKAKKVAPFTMRTKGGAILKHYGGALVVQGKTVKVIRCTFKKNHAVAGGAIYHEGGKLKLTANKFSGNTAKKGAKIQKG